MKSARQTHIAAFLLASVSMLTAAPPAITNIRVAQRTGTKFVDVTYNISDPDSSSLTLQVEFSANGGTTYDLPVRSLSGAVGAGVAPGNNRMLTWNAGNDWNGNWSDTCRVRLWAHDGSTPVPPLGMVYIPNGTFLMGPDPGLEVSIPLSYFMDRTEVSAELWNSVRNWGVANGYSDIGVGAFSAAGHPIQTVSWHDCLKWCNARSEKEGLTPCYYEDDAQTTVYRNGALILSSTKVKWTVNGHRLPTEAEWERAARGGLYRKLYPWGNTINGSMANFINSGDSFDTGPLQTTPCGYYNGNQLPTGQNTANGYGLYDVIGNALEVCWASNGAQPTLDGVIFLAGDGFSPRVAARGGGSLKYATDVATRDLPVGFHISWAHPEIGLRTIRGL